MLVTSNVNSRHKLSSLRQCEKLMRITIIMVRRRQIVGLEQLGCEVINGAINLSVTPQPCGDFHHFYNDFTQVVYIKQTASSFLAS